MVSRYLSGSLERRWFVRYLLALAVSATLMFGCGDGGDMGDAGSGGSAGAGAGGTSGAGGEGCGSTPGGCCEVDEDCTVSGVAQICMGDVCVCDTPSGYCDSCVTDEGCLSEGFVCLADTEGLLGCFDTSSDECIGGSLEDYCAGPCRSFDEALAAANALEEQDVPFCDDGTLWRSYSGVGTCDDFRWVMLRPSLDSRIEFFDAAGTMVAAEYWTDCDCFCDNTSFFKSYGPVPNCERVIGTLRRDCLDHVIVLGEQHLRRILRTHLEYYHGARTHLALDKDTPERRKHESPEGGKVIALPMVGGLHHRYTRRAA